MIRPSAAVNVLVSCVVLLFTQVPLWADSMEARDGILLFSGLGGDPEIEKPAVAQGLNERAVRRSGKGSEIIYEDGIKGKAARFGSTKGTSEVAVFQGSGFDFSDTGKDGGKLEFWLKFNEDPHVYSGSKFIMRTEPYLPAFTIEIYATNPYMVFEFRDKRNAENAGTNYRFLAYTGEWNRWLDWKKGEWHKLTLKWKRNSEPGEAEMHLFIDDTQEGCPASHCNDYHGYLPDEGAWKEVYIGNFGRQTTIDYSMDELKSFDRQ